MSDPSGHFTECRDPLCGAHALLFRRLLPKCHAEHRVDTVALSTVVLKAVVIRTDDVWHDRTLAELSR